MRPANRVAIPRSEFYQNKPECHVFMCWECLESKLFPFSLLTLNHLIQAFFPVFPPNRKYWKFAWVILLFCIFSILKTLEANTSFKLPRVEVQTQDCLWCYFLPRLLVESVWSWHGNPSYPERIAIICLLSSPIRGVYSLWFSNEPINQPIGVREKAKSIKSIICTVTECMGYALCIKISD